MAKAKHYSLKAEKRDRAGKGVARALRRENKIPAVIYGDHKEPVTIALDAKDTTLEYHKGHMYNMLCEMAVDGDKHQVLARDIQVHPVTDNVLHIDFLRVSPKTKLVVSVPVHFINEDKCPGLTEKGVLNVVRHEVDLLCSATSIPEAVELDMSGFEIGDAIKLSNATMPEGSTSAITDRDVTIATLAAPRAVVEETTEEEGEEGEAAEGEEGEASEEASDE